MRCSNCGQEGHNRRRCKHFPVFMDDETRDRALIFRIDGITAKRAG